MRNVNLTTLMCGFMASLSPTIASAEKYLFN